jgi:hypothetical protein
MYFVYKYEYGALKLVELISRRGVSEEGDSWKG